MSGSKSYDLTRRSELQRPGGAVPAFLSALHGATLPQSARASLEPVKRIERNLIFAAYLEVQVR
ncbi:MAG TPA: hypothetical protein VFW66_04320, partial [Gemmatimonadales bacterium]|nr:hypothetical protein [Gemmatimonadales bacterium]